MAARQINVEKKLKRVWEWVFPTVMVAMTPLLIEYVWVVMNSSQSSYHINDILAYKGQILIVGVALLGESMTELVSRNIPTWQRQSVQTLCVAYILGASVIYVKLSESLRCVNVSTSNSALIADCARMSDISMMIFFAGIVLCLICKLIGRS
jgi:hypothetical protein